MEYLYKFSEVNDDKLESLSLNQLWFSKLNDLNDPFEGEYIISSEVSDSSDIVSAIKGFINSQGSNVSWELRETYKQLDAHSGEKLPEKDLNEIVKFLDDCLEEHMQAAKQLCACSFIQKSNDKDPLINNLMWSHYSDGLRGYCLKFDNDIIFKTLGTESNPILTRITVDYVDAVKAVNSIKYFSENFHELFPGIFLPAKIKMYNLFSTKSKDWKYENECRLFAGKSGQMPYSGEALIEVIIGDKMKTKHLENLKINALKANPKVVFRTARVKTGTYDIELVDVDS
ncbi:DUF2971 domain-containing protein [Moritella viscosa]|uniref:DUF2971 domain-containing protein n=2 Tax=Moritella viscosa TaxID=80854 RepID=A0ABY1HL73_9GAMM|nr:Putative uncharacterized protein [Moritella viscosa]SGZ15398.1 Putative uncharacterized protein [Moritella viscosa]SHO28647.1 Putative uncharacterized protein [Moritella viscosa]